MRDNTLPKGALPPEMVAKHSELLMVDIRPIDERRGPLGYIPASVSVPDNGAFEADMMRVEALVEASRAIVLVCQSDRRARVLLEQHHRWRGTPIVFLHGGIIGWMSADLPVAGVVQTTNAHFEAADQSDIFKALSSCFSAELIESSLNTGADDLPNPRELLQSCFDAEGVDPQNPDYGGVMRVLDRAAIHSWRTGTVLDRIRDNLDEFQAMLDDVMPSLLAQAS